LIVAFIIGYDKIKLVENKSTQPKNSFSILIPFRNEAENLPQLLDSLSKLEYPLGLFEILFIDDASTDNSKELIENFKIERKIHNSKILKNIRKSNSPKKDAIEIAIHQSKYDWIITTDADCVIPKKWLFQFDDFLQKNDSKMICAPVTYTVNNSFLEQFQLLDFMSLIGVTIGGFGIGKPFLCNGANLCYSKKAFLDVDAFNGNNNLASGDDIFLLEKLTNKYPSQVHYLKSRKAIVTTIPQPTFNELISQRLRWASKTASYKNWFGKFVGIIVFLMNFSILFLFITMLFKTAYLIPFIAVFSIKFIIDFIIIQKTLIFTKQPKNIFFYPFSTLFYPFFNIFIVLLTFIRKKYSWKERYFNT
jgi:cellulose synthase/poly-beta-1,6-N-acetylglucosamine synthase-like glycosyltransferase